MTFDIAKKYNLLGIFPKNRKNYGTAKDKQIAMKAIKENKEFVAFALNKLNKSYINQIIDYLVGFVIWANNCTLL